jgi:transcriptional regulator with XRE-family HTH domain
VNPKTLGMRIRQARERRGLSQEAFASQLTRDQRAISEIENGKRRLAVTELSKIAALLEAPILYFFEGEVAEGDYDQALLSEFHQLPTNEAKQAAIEIVRILLNTIYPQSSD